MKNKKTLLFNIIKKRLAHSNPDLFRIILDTEYTKIDFGYTAKEIYIEKGGGRIVQNTSIEIKETGKHYVLT
ncbi:hypothetical protein [Flavobacterium sp. W22_SRS_FP1]|uniref:hypothetical protein n=1 Tax=Flavobacterium sp. W22_SRS_FP1 TaxID=3240276 RepID=UPI003F90D6AA